MRLTLEVIGDGAAFEEDPEAEMARLLRLAASLVEVGRTSGSLRDVNGNTCGHWEVQT